MDQLLINLAAIVLNVIDRSLWLVTFGPLRNGYLASFFTKEPKYGLPIPHSVKRKGETHIYRNVSTLDKLVSKPVEGVCSMHDLWQHSVKRFPKRDCFGARHVLKEHKEIVMVDGKEKIWTIPELSPVVYKPYQEVDQQVADLGSGLKHLGVKRGDSVCIYEETRAEWLISAEACWAHGFTVVTAYANLGEDALAFAINQTESRVVITNGKLVANLINIVDKLPSLTAIVYLDTCKEAASYNGPLQLHSFQDVCNMGMVNKHDPTPTSGDDVAVIMYTSGSTALPKGVMITHNNLLAAVAGKSVLVTGDSAKHTYIGYLPLAHVLELSAELTMVALGVRIGFGNPRTLTDQGAKPCGDLRAIRPTLMAGVPRVFDTIKKGAQAKIQSSGRLASTLFKIGFAARLDAIRNNRYTPLFDLLIFNKFKQLIGGRLFRILSGGAPLGKDTQEFIRVCLDVPIGQGYGLTETTGASCVQDLDDNRTACVGAPYYAAEVKLVDVPEMGYTSEDKPYPRGEVWVRGPNIAKGYYKDEEKTRADFDSDGWFHTGDIALIYDNGSLSIIDRKKNLVKLAQGEYIALEKLESAYGNSQFVTPNGICVIADPEESFVVALIIPDKKQIIKYAADNGITAAAGAGASDHERFVALCKDAKVRAAVLKSLEAEAKKAHLKPFELVKEIRLLSDEWTPENDCMTAAFKIKRQTIMNRYKDLIKDMYKGTSASDS